MFPVDPQLFGTVDESLKRLEGSPFQPQAVAFGRRLGELKDQFKNLNNMTGPQFTTAMLSLSNVLPGITSGALLAVEGFRDGDELSGARGVLDICAALAPVISAGVGLLAGPEGGLVGYLIGSFVGSIFNMTGDILGFFAPRAEALAKTLSDVLQNEKAEEAQKDIWKVHNSFFVYATALNTACSMMDSKLGSDNFRPGVTAEVIKELNLGEGNAIRDYWDVIGWLTKPTSQNHRLWPLVLAGACNAYATLLVAIVRLKSIVSSTVMSEWYKKADADGKQKLQTLWDIAEAKLTLYGACNAVNLDQLKRLTPVAQNRGTLWRLTRNFEVGVMDPGVSPVPHWGAFEFSKMSVTVCSNDQTLPEPVYRFYGIDLDSHVRLLRVSSYKTGAKKVADLAEDGGYLDGGQVINDVFATPGTDLNMKNHACVYELSNGGLKIAGKYRDENGKEIKTFCTFPFNETTLSTFSITAMTSVRAVNDPYAYAEDPSNLHLKDIKYIVYALEGTGSRVIFLINGNVLAIVQTPFGQTRGIAVDQDYLWTFTDTEFACATHASIIHKVRTNQELDLWIKSRDIPDAKPIHSLYPCDDGTIVASVKDTFEVYSTPYRVDLKKHIITAYDSDKPIKWTKIRDCRAQSLEKLPVFCWPEFESLRETLEALQSTFTRGKQAGA
jgi:hypothetical protein